MDAPAETLKEKVRRLPDRPGVYLMKDRFGQVIYVGKARSLKRRVAQYFTPSRRMEAHPKIRALIDLIHDFDTLDVRTEPEALLLEGRLIKQYRPKYNTDFTDDKRFLLVRVDPDEPLPRFRLARLKQDDRSRYYGPFAHSGHLRKALGQMRREFGVLLGDARPQRLADGRWRLYDDVRAELYGHANELTREEYLQRLADAEEFLLGKSREWLAELRVAMIEAAQRQQFEKAAELRDLVFALERTVEPARRFTRAMPAAPGGAEGAESLRGSLRLGEAPATIECFDISHISGTHVVASMVRFAGGHPDRGAYRRFRIRSFVGNDDFRAMEEVVGRRYRRLRDEGRPLPDLVVIDGGAGQVGAALRAFTVLEIPPPPLIGLAKREETIVFHDGRSPLSLPLNDPGLRLLVRIRDEAHRFANTYNADLRSKRIRESILDDFAGLGPVRRARLLEHFGSLERLRAASTVELLEVEGIGPKLATELAAFLRTKLGDTAGAAGAGADLPPA